MRRLDHRLRDRVRASGERLRVLRRDLGGRPHVSGRQRRPRRYPRGLRIVAARRQRQSAQGPWRFRLEGFPLVRGDLRLDPCRQGRHGLHRGSRQHRIRARTARRARCAGSPISWRPTAGRTGSPSAAVAFTGRRTTRRSRCRRRPARSSGVTISRAGRSSSSTSPRSSGRASYFSGRSGTRRSGAAPFTPSTHGPARSGGSSTRSRILGPTRYRPAAAESGTRSRSMSVGGCTRATPTRGRGEAARGYPNGAAYPGTALYTDSLIVLDARTGKLKWFDQVTPHDIRDHDFEATPMLVTANGTKLVIGGGKGGHVIAWNRDTRKRVWETTVGVHRNDTGPLPRHRVTVCPGLFGGIETPMAYASGRVFVPVVNLCGRGSATSPRASRAFGRTAATESSTRSTRQTGKFSGTGICRRPTSAARRPSTTSCSRHLGRRGVRVRRRNGKLLWHARCPPGSTAVRRSTATCY